MGFNDNRIQTEEEEVVIIICSLGFYICLTKFILRFSQKYLSKEEENWPIFCPIIKNI